MSNDPTAGIDPKGSEGAKKAPLHLIPSFPIHEAAWVLKLGADKYGEFNWRHNRVKASTYRSAMHRHLDQWFDGLEDEDSESGRSHLAHVISSAIIVLDALKHGTLADDRPPRAALELDKATPAIPGATIAWQPGLKIMIAGKLVDVPELPKGHDRFEFFEPGVGTGPGKATIGLMAHGWGASGSAYGWHMMARRGDNDGDFWSIYPEGKKNPMFWIVAHKTPVPISTNC